MKRGYTERIVSKLPFNSDFKWNTVNYLFQYGSKILFGLIFARLLDPKDFGLFALVISFTSITEIILNGGMRTSIMRSKEITNNELSSIFFYNLVVGLLLLGINLSVSRLVQDIYKMDNLALSLNIIGFSYIFRSCMIVQRALLEQRMQYKQLAYISIISTLLSSLLAIAAIYKGYGYWGLVLNFVLFDFFTLVLSWYYSPWRPTRINIPIFRSSISPHFKFGKNILYTRISEVIIEKFDVLLLSSYLPTGVIGNYNKGRSYGEIPSQIASSILLRPVIPVLSKDERKLQANYNRFLSQLLYLFLPATCFGYLLVNTFVLHILTEKWGSSIVFIKITMLAGLARSISALNKSALLAMGDSRTTFRINVVTTIGNTLVIFALFIFKIPSIEIILFAFLVFSIFELLLLDFAAIKKGISTKGSRNKAYIIVAGGLFLSVFLDYLINGNFL